MPTKIAQKQARILNVRVDGTRSKRVLTSVTTFLAQGHKFLITTPNPEIILAAQQDPKLAAALEKADINLPDGQGLVWAGRILGDSVPAQVVKGREMFLDLVSLANKKRWKLFLLGDDGAQEAARVLSRSYHKVVIASAPGPKLTKNAKPVTEADSQIQKVILNHINKFRPHILFVAFGAPKQEKWLLANWTDLDIGGAMVIGGALDFVNGRAQLPPAWIARRGLEWLWRLIHQPWRIARIFRAVVLFPLKVILARLQLTRTNNL